MQLLKGEEIARAVNGKIISGDPDAGFSGICTDSRKVLSGDLFVPIVGINFDGHDFIDAALKGGAHGAISDRAVESCEDKLIIKVDDTLKALGELASYYRHKFSVPFVAVTGSVGKTSTKDMIASVLSKKYKVLKTDGNFNNEIGLPLTLFRLQGCHEVGVVEMGMSGFGEISRLSAIAKPDIAIITNIGMSHIEKLGSQENILKAKMEIFESLHKNGLAILNGDDDLLFHLKEVLPYRKVFFGKREGVDYRAYGIETIGGKGTCFKVLVKGLEYEVFIPVPGVHNVYNALAAIAVGLELNLTMEHILKGIEEFSPGKMRLEVTSIHGAKIINDSYNASPQSMEAAIDVLKEISGKARSIAVLGDMLEMGEWAKGAHIGVGRYAAFKKVDCLVTVGEIAKNIALGALEAGMKENNVFSFNSNAEASDFLASYYKAGDTMLFKASRGMKLEEIIEHLKRCPVT